MLELDALAEGHDFFSLGGSATSPDERLLAYAVDTVGDERYTVRFRALVPPAGTDAATAPAEELTGVLGGVTWEPSGEAVYYSTVDDTWRPDKVWRHRLGTDQSDDELVHHETDGRFWTGIGRTRSDRFLMIATGSKTTSEWRFWDAERPELGFRVFAERREGLEYSLEHAVLDGADVLLVLHDATGPDHELGVAPPEPTAPEQWRALLPHDPAVRLETWTPSPATWWCTSAAVATPSCGSSSWATRAPACPPGSPATTWSTSSARSAPSGRGPTPTGTSPRSASGCCPSPCRRRSTTTTSAPMSCACQADARARRPRPRRLRRAAAVGHRPRRRARADLAGLPGRPARCGRRGPLRAAAAAALRLRRLRDLDGPDLLHLRLSLLDRGGAFAIAHVRGGGEMGRRWYDDGKLEHKQHSFDDFVACARHLAETGGTTRRSPSPRAAAPAAC